jgi:hypothetical protein
MCNRAIKLGVTRFMYATLWILLMCHKDSDFKHPSFQHTTYQLLYIYSIPPDDGLQICLKHVEAK